MEISLPEVHNLSDTCHISWVLRITNFLLSTMWEKTRGLSEFQLMLSTPCHSAVSIYVNWHPTAPEVVTYHMDYCASSRNHNAAKQCFPELSHPGATRRCDAGSLCSLSATTCAHIPGRSWTGLHPLLGGARPPSARTGYMTTPLRGPPPPS